MSIDGSMETLIRTQVRTTKPMRDKRDHKWQKDDVVVIGGARWRIDEISRGRGVKLRCMNGVNHGSTWETTLRNLPKKVLS